MLDHTRRSNTRRNVVGTREMEGTGSAIALLARCNGCNDIIVSMILHGDTNYAEKFRMLIIYVPLGNG
jgi:hypothetical protein